MWFARERTLSIHSIVTLPRELFYWLTVLVTFALGTAAGDWTLSAELLRTRAKSEQVLTPAGRPADLSMQDTVVLPLTDPDRASDVRLSRLGAKDALLIGSAQIAALFAGISTIVAGLFQGLRQ
ncbi:hypothetical protein AB0E01_27370 [Nocardia vinacea]